MKPSIFENYTKALNWSSKRRGQTPKTKESQIEKTVGKMRREILQVEIENKWLERGLFGFVYV